MKKSFKKLVQKYGLLFFFIMLFVFMVVFRISFRDVGKTILSLRFWQLPVLLTVFFLISFFRICVRKYLLSALNYSCSLRNLTLIHFSTMAAHYSTPAKIGFPLAVYLLNRFENVPYPRSTAAILIELVVSSGICGVIAVIGGFFYFKDHGYYFLQLICGVIILGVIALGAIKRVIKKGTNHSRVKKFLADVTAAFSYIALSRIILYTGIMTGIQVFSSINLLLLCHFLSADLSLWQAVTAGSTAFFIGAISMIPMGLGTRDASMLFYLKLFGISGPIGISIVTIQRLLSTGLSFILGTLFGAVLGLKNMRQQNQAECINDS